MDVAMFFPGTEVVQDRWRRFSGIDHYFTCYLYRYSQGHVVPSIDRQQDFCVIQTNITGQNVYVTFERFSTTGDVNDISFTSNVYLMFSMGSYTLLNGTNSFNPQQHF